MIRLLILLLISSLAIYAADARLPLTIFLANLTVIAFSRRRRELLSRLKFLTVLTGLVISLQWLARQPLSFLPVIKVGALSLSVLTYTALTPPAQIAAAFGWFGPKGQLLISLTLNLIPIIFQEARTIRLVQLSRGAKNPLAILVPLLHRTLRRSQQLALVLETHSPLLSLNKTHRIQTVGKDKT